MKPSTLNDLKGAIIQASQEKENPEIGFENFSDELLNRIVKEEINCKQIAIDILKNRLQ